MKKLFALATVICLLMLTCACAAGGTTAGSGATSQPAPSPSSSQAETSTDTSGGAKPKITFWYHVSDNEEYLRNLYTKQLEPVFDEIDIEFVGVPVDQYENKLRIACNSGNAPDVFMVDGVYTANFAAYGMLAPLDDYWPREDFEDYVQTSQDKCIYDGKIYAASQQESSCVLFYNADMFEAAGITDIAKSVDEAWTYERLIEAAQQLTIKDASGTIIQYGLQPSMVAPDKSNEGQTFTNLNWIWNLGGEVVAPDMSVATGYMDSEKTIAAMQLYADLFLKYQCSPQQTIDQGFQVGKIAMLIHNVASIGSYRANYPDLNFGVMPLPKGEYQYGTSGGWNYAISSQSKNMDAAWKALHSLTGKEGHKIHIEMTRAMPSRLSTIEELSFLREEPELIIASDLLKIGRARPITPAYNEISPLICDAMNAVAFGENPATVAKSTASKMDMILAKYKNM